MEKYTYSNKIPTAKQLELVVIINEVFNLNFVPVCGGECAKFIGNFLPKLKELQSDANFESCADDWQLEWSPWD